jgi:hypothetical protein
MTKRKRKVEQVSREKESLLVKDLASIWVQAVMPRLPDVGACVAGSRFGSEFMKELGVHAWATQLDAIAIDEQSYQEMLRGEAPNGWSVGAFSMTTVPNKWNGHVVVETTNWFIDLTAGQFDRPDKGIVFGNGLCVPAEEIIFHENIWHGDWFEVPVAQGHYLFRDAVVKRDITKAPDWHNGLDILRATVKIS